MKADGPKGLFCRSNEELEEVLMTVLWLNLSFVIFKVLTHVMLVIQDYQWQNSSHLYLTSEENLEICLPSQLSKQPSHCSCNEVLPHFNSFLVLKKVTWSQKQLLKLVRKEQFHADRTWTEVYRHGEFIALPNLQNYPSSFQSHSFLPALKFLKSSLEPPYTFLPFAWDTPQMGCYSSTSVTAVC